MSKGADYVHKEYPKTCDPKDFFGQVKRTVNGKPIGQDQIDQIIHAIDAGLNFNSEDVVLDIGCGNGALSVLFFDKIKSYLGVDFSEYLIGIAKENFEKEGFEFICDDALNFLERAELDNTITKVLCYGVFSYFDESSAGRILKLVNERYPNAVSFYIGNLPDKDLADKFYYAHIDYKNLLDDHTSPIGKWRTVSEFKTLSRQKGWNASIKRMPPGFYSAHYRYDVLLTRIG